MATFLSDTFTGGTGVALTSHAGETGATWTKHGSSGAGTMILSDANRLRVGATGGVVLYYASGLPVTADYNVVSPVFVASNTTRTIGVVGRIDTAANTYYAAFYDGTNSRWELRVVSAGTPTTLGTFSQALTVSSTYTLTLSMKGTAIALLVDGTSRVSVTDSTVSAAGRAGVFGATASSNTTGYHLDSIQAADLTYVDSLSGSVTGSGSASELLRHLSTGSATANIAGAASESLARSATRQGTVTLSGSFTGVHRLQDASAAGVALGGQGAEAWSSSTTATGTVTLTGSGSEIWGRIVEDTAAGTCTISGGAEEALRHHRWGLLSEGKWGAQGERDWPVTLEGNW